MGRTFLFLIFISLCPIWASAQLSRVRLGLMGGITTSNIYSGSQWMETTHGFRRGGSVGLFFEYVFHRRVTFHIGLQYSGMGTTHRPFISTLTANENFESRYRFTYLKVPLMVKGHVNDLLYFGLGISPSYFTHGNINILVLNGTDTQPLYDLDDLRRFDIGLLPAIGTSVDFGGVLDIGVELRGYIGAINIFSVNRLDPSGQELTGRNLSVDLLFRVGYRI